MYKVIGREKLGDKRLGRYIVEFSCRWPQEASFLYLVSTFTSYFPGRIEMKREESRGKAIVKLWEGVYPYRFASTCGASFLDEENPLKETLKPWPDSDYTAEFSLAMIGVEEFIKASREEIAPPELIIHDENDPAFISYYLGDTIIRLKAPRNTLRGAYIETSKGKVVQMEKFHSNKFVDYFQGRVAGRVDTYRFLLRLEDGDTVYGKNGVGDEEYIYPVTIRGVEHAEWFLGATYYLIFPDSFTREKKVIQGDRPRTRLGGKIKDITLSLDHIATLGVDAIYLTPIYKAQSYHRYDVVDHFSLDDDIGTWEDWEELVRESEKRNIKVVVDVVAHHVSPCSNEFREAILNENSRYKEWFRFNREPEPGELEALRKLVSGGCGKPSSDLLGKKPFYETFFCNWFMAKLNYSNPEVKERLVKLAHFWLEKGARGFRIDVGHAIPDDAMQFFYERVKEKCPSCPVILEITNGDSLYPLGITADSAMNYDLRALLLDFFINKSIDAYSFVEGVKNLYVNMPLYAANSMYNLLGSHDTPRIATLAEKCGEKCLKALYVAMFLLPGSPSIYYGDEFGMKGGHDPNNRMPITWNSNEWNIELLELIRKLSELRKKFLSVKYGFFDAEPLNTEAVKITRWMDSEEVLIIINREGNIEVALKEEYTELNSDRRTRRIGLGPYSWVILYKKK
ncbi:MAG: hypothetical protein GU357_00355 [Thermofilum sp.]|nr:hypothetical protein [Thermofilum sp.]